MGRRINGTSLGMIEEGRYVVGVGSERGTPLEVIGQGVMQCLDRYQVRIEDVSLVVSVDLKFYDPAYAAFARIHNVPFMTCDTLSLKSVSQADSTRRHLSWFDSRAVSELSALFFSGARRLLAPPFRFRLSLDCHSVVVSICRRGEVGINTGR